ncbi:MAG: P-II family nitrogen regulator [candidate division KSB1 bacterium]|nr:P-II family nitrogen regulator [candidate division KSB1 bacterium]
MKMVTAIIREDRLEAVREALAKIGIFSLTVNPVLGHGNASGLSSSLKAKTLPSLLPKLRIDTAVDDEFVEPTIEAIMTVAQSGYVGDGKIFVTPLEESVRIRTGERGRVALY